MFAWLKKATDSNTFLGNAVLCGLFLAVLVIWGCFLGGCALDDQGLGALVADDARVRTEHPGVEPDSTPPVMDAAVLADVGPAPDVVPAIALDGAVVDVHAEAQPPDVLPPPDMAPPLLGIGERCETDAACASKECSGRGPFHVCTDRKCGECEQSTSDGHCAPAREGRACGSGPSCSMPDPTGDWLCVSIDSGVCRSGVCMMAQPINCCAMGRVCDRSGGCRAK
jgi:hypothetical protein